jgi:thermitase
MRPRETRGWRPAAAALLVVFGASLGASAGEAAPKPRFEKSTVLVKFALPDRAASVVRRLGDRLAGFTGTQVAIVKLQRGEKVERKVAQYRALPGVTYAEPNFYARGSVSNPNDSSFGSQWGFTKIHAVEGWSQFPGSYDARSAIKLAVIDTGVESTHEDLNDGRVLVALGADCQSGSCSAGSAMDDNGHGTHVAGIAAAETNNGTGVAGVGFAVSVIPVKVLGADNAGTYAAIASGIVWAAQHGARVLNLSISGSAQSQTLCEAVAQATSLGSLVVAAAGNNGSSAASYPAACPEGVGVSATDSNDALASFSSFGSPNVFVSAPGTSIMSTYLRNSYTQLSGTSMASPHVAGLAALLFAQAPTRTVAEVKYVLATTSDKVGGSYGSDPYGTCAGCTWSQSWGYGRINAGLALNALNGAPPDYRLTASPALSTIGAGETTTYNVAVDAFGGFTGSVQLSVAGLPLGATATFSPAAVSGAGTSTLAVSTTALTLPGSYRMTITGTSGSTLRSTSVTLAVALAPPVPLPVPSSGFTLSVTSPTRGVTKPGVPVVFAITITPAATFNEPVVLSVTGQPERATAVFAPPTAPAPGASVLTIETEPTTPTGIYPLTITGSTRSIVQSVRTTLQLTAVRS